MLAIIRMNDNYLMEQPYNLCNYFPKHKFGSKVKHDKYSILIYVFRYDSTGMFHWCPSRDLKDSLMDRQEAAMTVLQVRSRIMVSYPTYIPTFMSDGPSALKPATTVLIRYFLSGPRDYRCVRRPRQCFDRVAESCDAPQGLKPHLQRTHSGCHSGGRRLHQT